MIGTMSREMPISKDRKYVHMVGILFSIFNIFPCCALGSDVEDKIDFSKGDLDEK